MVVAENGSDALDAPYFDALRNGGLVMQRCKSCRTWHWPAVARCAECGGWDQGWDDIPMEGALYSWIRTHNAFPATESHELPFVTVLVEIPGTDGHRLMGVWEGDEDVLSMGLPVKGRLDWVDDRGRPVPCIRWSAKG